MLSTLRLRATVFGAVAATATVVALATPVSAHDPIFLTEEQTTPDTGPYLPDGSISWAIYGVFPEGGQTRGFEFDLREGDDLYVGLLIPNLEPEIGLPDAELPYVELTMPDGSVRTLEAEIREVFDEQFSQTSYLTLVEIKEPAISGRHSVLVHSLAPSRFVVAVGEQEVFFTPAERTVDRPTDFLSIAEPLNAWYQTPPGDDPADPDPTGADPDEVEVDVEAMEDELAAIAEEEAAAAEAAAHDAADETLPTGPTDDAATSGAAESGLAEEASGGVGDDAPQADAAEAPEAEPAEAPEVDSPGGDDGSGLGWVVPLAIVVAAVGGAGFWLVRRRPSDA